MYHTQKINQAPVQKNLHLTRFYSKNLHTDNYIATLTPLEQDIFLVYLEFRNKQWINLTNKYIASRIGCSIKTVTRATNKFHRDGFITKHQENKYAPNNYTFNEKVKQGNFSQWINSLSLNNQSLYISHGIIIDHKNKIIFSYKNVPQNKSLILEEDLFINPSLTRMRRGRVFKKTYDPKKGNQVSIYQKRGPMTTKPRNKDGHSPVVLKPVLPLKDQIHAKKVDIAFFEKQLEKPEAFWDHRSILFEAQITMAQSLLARARFELNELEGNSNEKQRLLHQNSTNSMATCSA